MSEWSVRSLPTNLHFKWSSSNCSYYQSLKFVYKLYAFFGSETSVSIPFIINSLIFIFNHKIACLSWSVLVDLGFRENSFDNFWCIIGLRKTASCSTVYNFNIKGCFDLGHGLNFRGHFRFNSSHLFILKNITNKWFEFEFDQKLKNYGNWKSALITNKKIF